MAAARINYPKMPNPRVFFDISFSGKIVGRVIMEFFSDTTPLTADNFRALCTGEKGMGKSGKFLLYKGSEFHWIVPGIMFRGGDITGGNGIGGESIYGYKFDDENFIQHTGPGTLCMANYGSNSNGSLFFICGKKLPLFEGKCVVFGRVMEGLDVMMDIEKVGRRPIEDNVVIADCGELS